MTGGHEQSDSVLQSRVRLIHLGGIKVGQAVIMHLLVCCNAKYTALSKCVLAQNVELQPNRAFRSNSQFTGNTGAIDMS